jgi:hypothetical protein
MKYINYIRLVFWLGTLALTGIVREMYITWWRKGGQLHVSTEICNSVTLPVVLYGVRIVLEQTQSSYPLLDVSMKNEICRQQP